MKHQVLKDEYFRKLLRKERIEKKPISLYIEDENLKQLDLIVKVFCSISDRNISRNMLISDALENYVKDAKRYLIEEYGLNIDEMESAVTETKIIQMEGLNNERSR